MTRWLPQSSSTTSTRPWSGAISNTAGARSAGLPDAIIPMLVSFDVNAKNGGFDVVTDGVKTLTGREPKPLREFLAANKAALGG